MNPVLLLCAALAIILAYRAGHTLFAATAIGAGAPGRHRGTVAGT